MMLDAEYPLLPQFQENEVLFGRDRSPALIAFEIEGGDKVRVFTQAGNQTCSATESFQPFLLLAGEKWLKGWRGDGQIQTLSGSGALNRLVRFPNLKQLEDAKTFLQKKSGKPPSANDAPYWYFSDPLHQFFLLSGKSHFLGMRFHDLRRMQVDIETYCQAGFEFPNASRESDRITAIALADSTGWERVISGKEFDEAAMLREFTKEIQGSPSRG